MHEVAFHTLFSLFLSVNTCFDMLMLCHCDKDQEPAPQCERDQFYDEIACFIQATRLTQIRSIVNSTAGRSTAYAATSSPTAPNSYLRDDNRNDYQLTATSRHLHSILLKMKSPKGRALLKHLMLNKRFVLVFILSDLSEQHDVLCIHASYISCVLHLVPQ